MRPLRRFHVSSKACDSSGSEPASPSTSSRMASTKPGLEVPAILRRRFLNRGAQLLARHGADIVLVLRQRRAQVVKLGAVGVEVGAQREDDGRDAFGHGSGQQVVDIRLLLRVVLAEREQFLELVDDQQQAGCASSWQSVE